MAESVGGGSQNGLGRGDPRPPQISIRRLVRPAPGRAVQAREGSVTVMDSSMLCVCDSVQFLLSPVCLEIPSPLANTNLGFKR